MVLRLQYNTVLIVQNFSALFLRFIAYCLERKATETVIITIVINVLHIFSYNTYH